MLSRLDDHSPVPRKIDTELRKSIGVKDLGPDCIQYQIYTTVGFHPDDISCLVAGGTETLTTVSDDPLYHDLYVNGLT